MNRLKQTIQLFICLCGQIVFSQDTPVGWASVNGGTSGGFGGDTVTVHTLSDLLSAIKTSSPRLIMIPDTIDLSGRGRISVKASNLTFLGSGPGAMLRNGGLMIYGNNIIVRNLSIGDSYIDGHWDGKGDPSADALTLYGKNIWIDHCDLFHSYDGLLDVSHSGPDAADFVTVSWTRFSNHNKVMLIGSNDEDTQCRNHLNVTVHHCWFDGSSTFFDKLDRKHYRLTQRLPRVRFGDVHVFNNYYEEVEGYCIAARFESDVVVENNFFRNLDDPHIIDDMGKGIENPDLVARGNVYDNVRGDTATSGMAFDPLSFYDYKMDNVFDVPAVVMNGAGKFNRSGNIPPVAVDDTIYVKTKVELVITPLENDFDKDGDNIRISGITNNPQGKTIVYPQVIKYYPSSCFAGSDTIVYQIIDYQGGIDNGMVIIKAQTGF